MKANNIADQDAERREAKKAYDKAYRASHKEQKRATDKAYRASHKEEKKAYDKAYGLAHREERNAAAVERYWRDPVGSRLKSAPRRARYQNAKSRDSNIRRFLRAGFSPGFILSCLISGSSGTNKRD